MDVKYNIDSEYVKRLISEDLLYFVITSQISSDCILEKTNLERRLNIIKTIKTIMNDLTCEKKDKYLDLLDKCEDILNKDLTDLSNKKIN